MGLGKEFTFMQLPWYYRQRTESVTQLSFFTHDNNLESA